MGVAGVPRCVPREPPEALELVLLLVDDPRRLRRAALRWHATYFGELLAVGFEEAHAGWRASPARRDGVRWPRLARWPNSSTSAISDVQSAAAAAMGELGTAGRKDSPGLPTPRKA